MKLLEVHLRCFSHQNGKSKYGAKTVVGTALIILHGWMHEKKVDK